MQLVPLHRGGKEELEGMAAKDPPTAEEVHDMAEYLGIEDGDTEAVKRVARLAVSAPLPPGWAESTDEGGEPIFKNDATGSTQEEHPLDGYFIELVRRNREGGAVVARDTDGWPGNLEDALMTPRRAGAGGAGAPDPIAIPSPGGGGAAPLSASKDGAKARASPRTRGAEAGGGAGGGVPSTPPLGAQPTTPEVMARVQAGEAMFSQHSSIPEHPPIRPLLPMPTAKAGAVQLLNPVVTRSLNASGFINP
jgi:hypothetical protein